MKAHQRFVAMWFIVGAVTGLFFQWTQVVSYDGRWDSLLAVGETGPGREFIQAELPDLSLVPGVGHDGQTVYIVARDPFMTDGTAAAGLDDAGFRYRRILNPLIAGGGGTFSPSGVVAGMVLLSIISYGAATAAVAHLVGSSRLSRWACVAFLLAPGMWISARLLTIDIQALALLLLGIIAIRSKRWGVAALLFTAAALTKEVYLIGAGAAAITTWLGGQRRQALIIGGLPVGSLVAWSWLVTLGVGAGFTPRDALGLPFQAVAASVPMWFDASAGNVLIGFSTLGSIVLASWAIWRSRDRLLRLNLALWILVGIVSSELVWNVAINAARAVLPVWVLAIVILARPDSEVTTA